MNAIFVDSSYFIALVSECDNWHNAAVEIEAYISDIKSLKLVTSYAVLSEVLASFSRRFDFRQAVSEGIEQIRREERFVIYELTEEVFSNALSLYHARADKRYSLVDCMSMNIMKELGLENVLSYDGDFNQEGLNQIKNKSDFLI